MAFTIAIVQQKGGAGKSTLLCQLAAGLLARKRKVAIVDTDPQQSTGYWLDQRARWSREEPRLIRETRSGSLALSGLAQLQAAADFVLIDTAGQESTMNRRAIRLADLALVPVQLTPLDLHATQKTVATIVSLRTEMLFVLNRVPARAKIADAMRQQLCAHDLPVARTVLGNRAIYAESMVRGRGANEMPNAGKAGAEVTALAGEIVRHAAQRGARADTRRHAA